MVGRTLHSFKTDKGIEVTVVEGNRNQMYINFRDLFINDGENPIDKTAGLDKAICQALVKQRIEWYRTRGMSYDESAFMDIEAKIEDHFGDMSDLRRMVKRAVGAAGPIVATKEFNVSDLTKYIPSVPIASDEVRKHIPTVDPNWDYSAPMYQSVVESVMTDNPLILIGPTGSGKTSGVLQIAGLTNNPVRRCPCNSSTGFSEFFGEVALVVDESGNQITKRTDGWVTWACRVGAWVLLDEADSLDPAVALSLYSLLEEGHNGQRFITIPPGSGRPGGEVVGVHPNTRIFLTGNNFGTDTDMMYAGTEQIFSVAFLDRCDITHVDYPDVGVVADILEKKTGIDGSIAANIAVIMSEINVSHKNDNLPWVFSLRRALALAKRYNLYTGDMPKARPFKAAMDKIVYEGITNKDTRDLVIGICQRLLGRKA